MIFGVTERGQLLRSTDFSLTIPLLAVDMVASAVPLASASAVSLDSADTPLIPRAVSPTIQTIPRPN